MGYRYSINKVEVRVEAEKVPQMLEALASNAKEYIKNKALWRVRQNREILENGRDKAEFYVSRLNDEIRKSEEILRSLPNRELSREEIFENLLWCYYFEDEGGLTGMYHSSETRDVNEEELEAISPFVNDGSFVEVSGDDDDDIFRYIFRNGKMRKVHAVISFPEE